MLDHPVSRDLYEWLSYAKIPDEHFYSTLATELIQDVNSDTSRGECVRFTLWQRRRCSGVAVRGICNFGMRELEKVWGKTREKVTCQ